MHGDLSQRIERLVAQGVDVVDPRQTYVAPEVDPERIRPGVVLHPGTRLQGARTYLCPGARIGVEGPATVVDAVFGPDTAIDSGFVNGAVLLRGASLGANAHVRPGTLLEEEASTAHAVGLKHTILLSFVTLGSLINFCDVLMAGGTSRTDHSEVGSGFIHFNFTPWGRRGDKATPSLVGDVVGGVMLSQPRIFLGGAGGMVGPRHVGYGSIAAAGQVLRRDLAPGTLASQALPTISKPVVPTSLDAAEPRGRRNVEYIAQLVVLRAWYRAVRLARAADDDTRVVVSAAIDTIGLAIDERVTRLRSFLEERKQAMPELDLEPDIACPGLESSTLDHVAWVRGLGDPERALLQGWLGAVAAAVVTSRA